MPKTPDFTQVALRVVQQATGEAPKKAAPTAKQEAGRKGGLKGGSTRMERLSPEERRELALKAAAARWDQQKAPAPVAATGVRKR